MKKKPKPKTILCFIALPETPRSKWLSAFPVAGSFESKKSYGAWQIVVSRPEVFLSTTCFIPVAAVAKEDKVTKKDKGWPWPGHTACYSCVDKGEI